MFPRKAKFGLPATNWKEWSFRGLDVLMPSDFRAKTEPNGDILMYAEGDGTAPPSGRMPRAATFLMPSYGSPKSTRKSWIRRTTWKSFARCPTRILNGTCGGCPKERPRDEPSWPEGSAVQVLAILRPCLRLA